VVLDEATVAEYAEAMNCGTKLPPVTVYFDGDDYWLADGFHRCAACEACGTQTVLAEVRDGNRREAILHSVGVNATHGLRRRNEDKRRAVMTLLEDEEWSKWSDSEIARRCAVDHKTVAGYRGSILGISQDSGRRTVSRHGHRYEMDVSKVGRGTPPTSKTTKPCSPASRPEPTAKTGAVGIEPIFSDASDQRLDNLQHAWNSAPDEVRVRFLDLNGLAPVGGSAASTPEQVTEGESGPGHSASAAEGGSAEAPLSPNWDQVVETPTHQPAVEVDPAVKVQSANSAFADPPTCSLPRGCRYSRCPGTGHCLAHPVGSESRSGGVPAAIG
jgi:hypothetical protein